VLTADSGDQLSGARCGLPAFGNLPEDRRFRDARKDSPEFQRSPLLPNLPAVPTIVHSLRRSGRAMSSSLARRIVLSSPSPRPNRVRAAFRVPRRCRALTLIHAALATSEAPGRPTPATTTSSYTSSEMYTFECNRGKRSNQPILARMMSGEASETTFTIRVVQTIPAPAPNPRRYSLAVIRRALPRNP